MIKNIINDISKSILVNVVPNKELSKRKRAEYMKAYKIQRKLTSKELKVTLTLTDYKAFQKLAKTHGNTVNKEIVQLALAYTHKTYLVPIDIKEDLQTLIFLLRNIANNINQIAKNSNIFKTLLSTKKLLTNLQDLEKSVKEFINKPKSQCDDN